MIGQIYQDIMSQNLSFFYSKAGTICFTEMDEGFFEGHRKKDTQSIESKPVKELDRQVKAIVAVSTIPVAINDQQKHRPDTKAGYLK